MRSSIPQQLEQLRTRGENASDATPLLRADGWVLYRYEFPLLDVVTVLHTSETGAGDTLTKRHRDILRLWLEARLDAWEPSIPTWAQNYDMSVRLLAESVLEEIKRK